MCMNDDFLKASQEENDKNVRKNKATFKKGLDSDRTDDLGIEDQVGLAFRKSAFSALN